MPDMSLRLSDFRVPALAAVALLAGLVAGFLFGAGQSGSSAAVPGQFLSASSVEEISPLAVARSRHPQARPSILPASARRPVRLAGFPCLEQARKPNGEPVTYVSNICLWYSGIDNSAFPRECVVALGGLGAGRPVFDAGCLIRVGFADSLVRR